MHHIEAGLEMARTPQEQAGQRCARRFQKHALPAAVRTQACDAGGAQPPTRPSPLGYTRPRRVHAMYATHPAYARAARTRAHTDGLLC